MTRASLLHILDHVTHISATEVRELEQLATAFPYCQTAHLLLAKAAHDQGSMLAAQRLRHAATYAADRELLRHLIELPPVVEQRPASNPAAVAAPESVATAPSPPAAPAEEPTSEVAAEAAASPAPLLAEALVIGSEAPAPHAEATSDEAAEGPQAATETTEALPEEALTGADELTVIAAEAEVAEPAPLAPEPEEPETPVAYAAAEPATAVAPDAVADPEAEPLPAAGPDLLPPTEPAEEAAPVAAEAEATELLPVAPAAPLLLDELPALPPPIRPPADTGSSRFEYGLAEVVPPRPAVAYELPELTDESAGKAVPAFYAAAAVGYGQPGGSRLGFALLPTDDTTAALPAEAFFEPDALLLDHVAAHQPPPVPTSIDLINRFLRNKPRLKSPAALPRVAVDEQQDLSVRSTRVVPELASESLAQILIKQGKTAKAIEIYERLMVRQPEKKAYFADQIQKLQTPE